MGGEAVKTQLHWFNLVISPRRKGSLNPIVRGPSNRERPLAAAQQSEKGARKRSAEGGRDKRRPSRYSRVSRRKRRSI